MPTDDDIPMLLEGVARGDEKAFRTLYEYLKRDVGGYVRLRLRRHGAHAIDEVEQEIWTGVWRGAAGSRDKSRNWIFRIAKNQCNKWFVEQRKKGGVEISVDDPDDVDIQTNQEGEVGRPTDTGTGQERLKRRTEGSPGSDETNDRIDLQKCIEKLPSDLQELCYLVHWLGMSVEETAAHFEIPQGTVKSRLHKMRKLLHDCMSGRKE